MAEQQAGQAVQNGLHALHSCQLRADLQLPWGTFCPAAQQLLQQHLTKAPAFGQSQSLSQNRGEHLASLDNASLEA